MRYIGGKSQLSDIILNVIENSGRNVNTVIDIFAGTGAVSKKLKSRGYRVIANDFLYFSYVLQKCYIELNEVPDFCRIGGHPVDFLNNIDIRFPRYAREKCFVYNNYSPAASKRMYFQPDNALKIDLIRLQIEDWYRSDLIDEKGYFYLLAALIEAVPYVSNIAGVYASYLKFWDKRTYNSLVLKPPVIFGNGMNNTAANLDYSRIISSYECDLLYADPPYNSREYLPNYHVLETIAKYDYPDVHGITGMRNYEKQRSDFCKKSKAVYAFENLIANCKAKYVLISYNNEGLLSTDVLVNLCKKYSVSGTFFLHEYEYRRYKNKIPNNSVGLKEQLYFFEKI